MSALLELAARCEQAQGPDWQLAIDINETLNIASYITDDGDPTASVDAASTLVPEGWVWSVDSIGNATVRDEDAFFDGCGATPALALCNALLRARAA